MPPKKSSKKREDVTTDVTPDVNDTTPDITETKTVLECDVKQEESEPHLLPDYEDVLLSVVTPDVTTDVTPDVNDTTPDITETKTALESDVKQEESEPRLMLNSEDEGKNSSALMKRDTSPLPKPVAHHIITTPPVSAPKLSIDGKRLESVPEKYGIVYSDCPCEAVDSPAAKQPRGRQRGRQRTAGSSKTRSCRRKAISSSRITQVSNDSIPSECRSKTESVSLMKESQSRSQQQTSQELKIESSPGERNKKLHDTKISDYYPIRRSSRRTESELKKEIDKNFEDRIKSKCQEGLAEQVFLDKGRGIVATRTFTRNEFVVEYVGDLIDFATAKMKESEYLAQKSGCYMYYFNHKNKNYCIDATAESPYFGRLVNHSRVKPNCHTKVVEVKGQPHLVLLASRKIERGEELLYDYGDRNKEALTAHPWLAF